MKKGSSSINKKILMPISLVITMLMATGCPKGNSDNQNLLYLLFHRGSSYSAPVLDDLVIGSYNANSITLAKPTLSVIGDPMPAVNAYVGLDGEISVNDATVTSSIEGPVDVSNAEYLFEGLNDRRMYRIIVIASNIHGNSIEEITQQTRGTGLWTWVSGDNTQGQSGIYGIKGVPADANKPGARWQGVSWIDGSDNLWLFGGLSGSATTGYLNDLWKFDGTRWTWMSGDNTTNQYGVYGVKGTADDANKPGTRFRLVSWTDSQGGLWLFGGRGYAASTSGLLNDLWKFDGSRWAWISGDSTTNQGSVYGTKGIPADTNKPGAREFFISWTDSLGNLWLFGGSNFSNSYLNDLWKFDGTQWTWVSGDNIANQRGVYGTKGVAEDSNKPGARWGSASWIDSSNNLWLFGGSGYDSTGVFGALNDLWKFDGSRWAWISGDTIVNQIGVYGTKGSAADENKPGARHASVAWIDMSGNLWLFGGYSGTFFNDLWKFDGTRWTWVSGDNAPDQVGVYGEKGVAAPGNKPGARGHSVSWIDSNGNLWLFGARCFDASKSVIHYNDLWKYSPE